MKKYTVEIIQFYTAIGCIFWGSIDAEGKMMDRVTSIAEE
jgi:hypothetical protein